jgi:hypothetical protein
VKRGIWLSLAALLAFAAILVGRMPASWVVPAPGRGPAGCASVEGSLWNGTCNGLTLGHNAVGDLSWELHPARLFAGRLAAHLSLAGAGTHAVADAELDRRRNVSARNLIADLPLDTRLLPSLPAGMKGSAHLDLSRLELANGIVTALQGRIEVHDLEDHAGHNTTLGSYQLQFPAASGEPVGQLRDLDGPLAVEGTLRLTRQGGFEVQGLVTPRASATPELTNNLRFLGTPDAAGRREFSLSGTF